MAELGDMIVKIEANIQQFQTALSQVDAILNKSDSRTASIVQRINSNLSGIGKSAKASASVFEQAMGSQSVAVTRLLAEMDPLSAKMTELKGVQNEVDAALRQGYLTTEQHAQATTYLRTQTDNLAAAQTKGAGSAKLSAYALQNLSYQINDIISGIAMGQPVTQILAQQGGQVVQVFGGLRNALGLLMNPWVALTAAIGTGAAAFAMHASSVRSLDMALNTSNGIVGLSKSQLEQLAEATSNAGGVTVTEARTIEGALAQIGTVGGKNFGALVKASSGVTKAGQDASTAVQEVAKALADPAKAAADLNGKYWDLSAAQQRQIQDMQRGGQIEQAQAVLIDALTAKMSNATQATTFWTRAVNALSNAWGNLGKEVSGPETIAEKLAAAKERLQATQAAATPSPFVEGLDTGVNTSAADQAGTAQADIIRLQQQLEEEQRAAATRARSQRNQGFIASGNTTADSIIAGLAERQALQKQIGTLQNGLNSALESGDTEAANRFEKALDGVNTALSTYQTEGEKALQMSQAQAAAAGMGTEAAQRYLAQKQIEISLEGQVKDPVERERLAKAALAEVDGVLAAQKAKLTREEQAEIDAATATAGAFGKSEQAGYADQIAQEARVNALKNGTSAEYELAKAVRERNKATADTIGTHAQELAAFERTNAAAQKVAQMAKIGSYAQGAAESEASVRATYEPQILQATNDNQRSTLTTQMDQALRQAEVSRQTASLLQTNTSTKAQQQDIALTQRKISLVGTATDKANEELAVYQATVEMHDRYGDQLPKEAEQYIENARAAAVLNNELQREQNILNEIGSFGDQAFSRIGEAMTDMALEGKDAFSDVRNIVRAVLSETYQEFIKLAAINPIKNALGLGGGNLATLGGILGDLFTGSASTGITGGTYVEGFGVAYAGGTSNAQSGWALVGEKGPELVNFGGGEKVYTAGDTSSMLSPAKTPTMSMPSVPSIAPSAANSNGDTYNHFVIDARGADREGLARLEQRIAIMNGTIERRAINAVADAASRGGTTAKRIRGR